MWGFIDHLRKQTNKHIQKIYDGQECKKTTNNTIDGLSLILLATVVAQIWPCPKLNLGYPKSEFRFRTSQTVNSDLGWSCPKFDHVPSLTWNIPNRIWDMSSLDALYYHVPEQTKVRLINVFINIYLTYIIALNVYYTFIIKLYV